MRTGKMLGIVMAVVLCFIISGCATSKTQEAYKDAGFLPDYSRLAPAPDNKGARVWRVSDAEMKKYNKILLERILVWQSENADYKGIDPTELKALVDYFHDAIVKALGNDYPVVTEPGPDVMRVKIAITQIVPTKPEVTVIVLVTPYATVADLASGAFDKGGVGSAPYLGDAAIEAMGLDSMTNELLFEYVERRIGKKYNVDHPTDYFQAYTTWGYTKLAFDYWAKKFRDRLDEIHGKKPAKT